MSVSMKAVQMRAVAARPSRSSSVVVRASSEKVDRRGVLGAFAAAVGASALFAKEAEAVVLPWQESTGGMVVGKGNMVKSPTAATMEGYTLEGFPGTKKPSFIEPKKKRKMLAATRAAAEKAASK